MQNEHEWQPSKFLLSGNTAYASRNSQIVSVSSRLIATLVADRYLKALPQHSHGRLLDLGCGAVPLYEMYRPHVEDIVCVDWVTSPHNSRHVDLHHDLTKPLPFQSDAFHTVVLSDVLEHIPTPDQLMSEIARVLAPGGKLILNVPFFYGIHEAPHDYYRYTEFALKRFVSQTRLEVVEFHALGGLPEVFGDLIAKTLSMVPFLGQVSAACVQRLVSQLARTKTGKRLSNRTASKFPLGYFLVAMKTS